jgi:hypothetical protein
MVANPMSIPAAPGAMLSHHLEAARERIAVVGEDGVEAVLAR